jgi:hypothetical protein
MPRKPSLPSSAIASAGKADPGGAESPAEAQVLGIAKMGFDAQRLA